MLGALAARLSPTVRRGRPTGAAFAAAGSSLLGPACAQAAGPSAGAYYSAGSNEYPPPDTSRAATADLADVHIPEPIDQITDRKVQVVLNIFRNYGGLVRFHGRATTVKCYENNPLVREALEEDGHGRVLVVDGGGSLRCALLGDNISEMGHKNGWKGIIINGCIRDSEDINRMPLAVRALNTHPIKSSKRDRGLRDVPVVIGGALIRPGDYVYGDLDGILVSPEPLDLQ